MALYRGLIGDIHGYELEIVCLSSRTNLNDRDLPLREWIGRRGKGEKFLSGKITRSYL
jgi:hypothetical protein